MRNIVKRQHFLIGGILVLLSTSLGCSLIVPNPPPKEEAWPTWAPDSQRLAYECYLEGPIQEGSRSIYDIDEGKGVRQSFYTQEAADICISDVDGSNQVGVTTDPGADLHPVWSPDSSHIVYLRPRDGFYLITPAGHNQRRLIPLRGNDYDGQGDHDSTNPVWSPDGSRLLFSACLDNSDRDIYVVDINTGAITNLTPNSRTQDIMSMWTLNGEKIVFLSTTSSLWPGTCRLKRDAPHQLKAIDADGNGEDLIYDEEFYYAFITVSNNGQIIFVADMVSKTSADFAHPPTKKSLYRIGLAGRELIELPLEENYEFIVLPSWSPNGEYLLYRSFPGLKILNLGTGEILELPAIESHIKNFVWSPNGQYIAANVSSQEYGASDEEDHIYIFDVHARTVRPLLQEQEKSENVN